MTNILKTLCPFFIYSVLSLHQGLPGNASSVFIWILVSSLHMWYSNLNIIVYFKVCRKALKQFSVLVSLMLI